MFSIYIIDKHRVMKAGTFSKSRAFRELSCLDIHYRMHHIVTLNSFFHAETKLNDDFNNKRLGWGSVHTRSEEFKNRGFTLKTHQLFSIHAIYIKAGGILRNGTITGQFGFVLEQISSTGL